MMKHFYQIVLFAICIVGIVVASFFTTHVELPEWSHIPSTVSLVAFALPCIWILRMWLGWRDALIVFAILGIFALTIEIVAVKTGFPYGRFNYSDLLAYKLFGVVPWTVALAWPPLLLASYAVVGNLITNRIARVVGTAVGLVIIDLVVDPAFVSLGFWSYESAGGFYGVPVSNFIGWLLSAIVGAALFELILLKLNPLLPIPIRLAISGSMTIAFATFVAIFSGLVVPAVLGFALIAGIATVWFFHDYNFEDRIVLVDEDDRPIATAPKLATHNSATPLHRAFSVFIFNGRGEILLQQRAFTKKTWPGVWSNSCCGHVMLHETIEHAAARRLKQELGLNCGALEIAVPDFRYRAEKDGVVEHEICPVLIGSCDAQPIPDISEVANVRWMSWDEFLVWVEDPESDLSPWAIEEVRRLEQSDVFKKWFAARFAASDAAVAVC
jgi:isopentenyl-diphosphate delta-isomerase